MSPKMFSNESLFTIQRLLTISRFHCSTWDIQLWSQSYLCLPSLYYHNIFDQISMINQDWFRIFLFGANSKAKINFIRRLSAARAQYTLAILAKCKCTANISTAQYTVLYCVPNTKYFSFTFQHRLQSNVYFPELKTKWRYSYQREQNPGTFERICF